MKLCAYDIEDVWPLVVDRIRGIMIRYPEHCDWSLADVYEACKSNSAILLSTDTVDSFAVVKVKQSPSGEKYLFIWIACGKNGKRDMNLHLLTEAAKIAGATRMVFESPRKGFDRLPCCKRGMTTYIMEV